MLSLFSEENINNTQRNISLHFINTLLSECDFDKFIKDGIVELNNNKMQERLSDKYDQDIIKKIKKVFKSRSSLTTFKNINNNVLTKFLNLILSRFRLHISMKQKRKGKGKVYETSILEVSWYEEFFPLTQELLDVIRELPKDLSGKDIAIRIREILLIHKAFSRNKILKLLSEEFPYKNTSLNNYIESIRNSIEYCDHVNTDINKLYLFVNTYIDSVIFNPP
jgi:hypothetical protein